MFEYTYDTVVFHYYYFRLKQDSTVPSQYLQMVL